MSKEMTHDQALELVTTKKEELKEAKTALKDFRKENSLKEGEEPKEEKLAKKLARLVAAQDKAVEALDQARETEKELRPKAERPSKYDYPEGLSNAEKKKYRAKARAEAKRALKEADKPKEEKAGKVKEEKAGEEPAKGGKSRKAKDED